MPKKLKRNRACCGDGLSRKETAAIVRQVREAYWKKYGKANFLKGRLK